MNNNLEYIDGLVSIITPVYNAERFIAETIKSVKMQTYDNWEMILVDDVSSDNSEKIIKEFQEKDKRIKYVKLNENSGAAVARNIGIEKAKGRYIAFLDSDDLWKREKLQKQIQFMKENDYGFTFTSYELMKEDGTKLDKMVKVPNKIDYNGLLKNTIIGCLTVIVDRDKVGDFKMPLIRKGQDTATWLSILKNHNYAYGLNEILGEYRVVNGSISSNKIGALKRTWRIYREVEHLNLAKSCFVFSCYVINAIKKRI